MLDFGLTPQDFHSQVRERKPHLQRGALKNLRFDWEQVNDLLHHIEPSEAGLQIFHDGPVPQDAYTEIAASAGLSRRRLNKRRFYALMRGGATLVLNRAEAHSAALQGLCTQVAQFCGESTSGNAYLSFDGGGSFGRHWDTHDVYALQLLGRKRWQLFEPTLALPLPQQLSREHAPPQAPPVLDVVLQAGDLLYVPRGWWHAVLPQGAGSFHFSVGSYGPTVQDYLLWVCRNALNDTLAARRALPPTGSTPDLDDALRALARAASDSQALAAFRLEMGSRQQRPAPFDVATFLEPGGDALADEARIRLNAQLRQQDAAAELVINGSRLRLDGPARAIVMLVTRQPRLSLQELSQALPQLPRAVLVSAVLELATHEALIIERG